MEISVQGTPYSQPLARDSEGYGVPLVMVDCAIFIIDEGELKVLLPTRRKAPEEGKRGLVGGRLHTNEDLTIEDAVRRVVVGKIGVDVRYMEQLSTYGGPLRDRGGWTVSVAYIAMVEAALVSKDLYADLFSVEDTAKLGLCFDHSDILRNAVARLRDKATYSSLPAFLLPEEFTLRELRDVYAVVTGTLPGKSWFRDQVARQGLVVPTGKMSHGGRHRPAELYRAAGLKNLDGRLKV
ncbi:NUDIX hydrolase [Acetobacter persici]|uniref:NUDIX hydrolase n=1 Tax=Acetobacter persici TaxID=1076596 RepID=UPI0020CF027E|nr:hypothetical protein [Acetobacter persici]